MAKIVMRHTALIRRSLVKKNRVCTRSADPALIRELTCRCGRCCSTHYHRGYCPSGHCGHGTGLSCDTDYNHGYYWQQNNLSLRAISRHLT